MGELEGGWRNQRAGQGCVCAQDRVIESQTLLGWRSGHRVRRLTREEWTWTGQGSPRTKERDLGSRVGRAEVGEDLGSVGDWKVMRAAGQGRPCPRPVQGQCG